MATVPRAEINLTKATIKSFAVQASGTCTQYMPVMEGTVEGDVLDATSGATAIGVWLSATATSGKGSVALFSGGGILPIKVGVAGATHDKFAVVGTTGAVDQTLGGGTVVKHVIGKFLNDGVSGDIIGLAPSLFDGVGA